MEQSVCEQCGQATVYKTGSKDGKPWAGYFCQDQACKHVQWVKLHTPAPKPPVPPTPPAPKPVSKPIVKDDFNETKQENSLMMCATNLVVAQINAGFAQSVANPGNAVVMTYWELKEGLIKKPVADWPDEPINEEING